MNILKCKFLTMVALISGILSFQTSFAVGEQSVGIIRIHNKTNVDLEGSIRLHDGYGFTVSPEQTSSRTIYGRPENLHIRWNTKAALGIKRPDYTEKFNFSGDTDIFIFKKGLFVILDRCTGEKTFKEIELNLVGKEINRITHDEQNFKRALKAAYPLKNSDTLLQGI